MEKPKSFHNVALLSSAIAAAKFLLTELHDFYIFLQQLQW
jgi:hypothetical protein